MRNQFSAGWELSWSRLVNPLVALASLTLLLAASSSATDASPTNVSPLQGVPRDPPNYGSSSYLIITRPMFENALAPLKEQKESWGLQVYIETVDDIVDAYPGGDIPERMRNCILDYHQNHGVGWVLLAGDADSEDRPTSLTSPALPSELDKNWEVPTRYIYLDVSTKKNDLTKPEGRWTPVDFYYAGLDGDWDYNGNGWFGERLLVFSEVDWSPEVHVGRIPAQTETEMETAVQKVVGYGNARPKVNHFLLLGAWDEETDMGLVKDRVAGLASGPICLIKLYSRDGNLLRTSVVNNINNFNPGLINASSHGHYTALTTYEQKDGEWDSSSFLTAYDVGPRGYISNENPFLMYADACLSSGFDYSGPSLGEASLLDSDGGAIAYIGFTRHSWHREGSGAPYSASGELDYLFWHEFFANERYQPGAALDAARAGYAAEVDGLDEEERQNLLGLCLLGDPQMPIRMTDELTIDILEVQAPSEVVAGDDLSVHFNVHNNLPRTLERVDVYLDLVDGSGQLIGGGLIGAIALGSDSSACYWQSISIPAGAPGGTYTLRARARYAGVDYFETGAIGAEGQNDGGFWGDAGNTIDEARFIDPGSYAGHLAPADDVDFYKCWIPAGEIFKVDMNPGGNYDLFLYDPGKNLLVGSESPGDESEEITYVAETSGYYYFEIRRISGSGDYSFSIEILDITPPTSSVDMIKPYWHNMLPLTVTAQASDDLSGVRSVTLWYRHSADNVSWGPWVSLGTDTVSPWSFTVPNGDGYYEFYTISVDWDGNIEEAPEQGDAWIGIDRVPPESFVNSIRPYWQSSLPLTVTACASDDRSGVEEVMLFYKYSGDNLGRSSWQLFGVDEEAPWSWEFDAPSGDGHYEFGTLSVDRAGNCEEGVEELTTRAGTFRGHYSWGPIHDAWVLSEIEGEYMYGLHENGAGLLPVSIWTEEVFIDEYWVRVSEPWIRLPEEPDEGVSFGDVTLQSVMPVRKWNTLVDEIYGWAEVEDWDWWEVDEYEFVFGACYAGSVTAKVWIAWPEATASAGVMRPPIELGETRSDEILPGRAHYYGFDIPERTLQISPYLDWSGSDLDLHLYDPGWRHSGWNYGTNELELEIPGAEYSGRDTKPEWVRVPEPQSGFWVVMIYPYEVEEEVPFTLEIFADASPPESSVEPISPYWQNTGTVR